MKRAEQTMEEAENGVKQQNRTEQSSRESGHRIRSETDNNTGPERETVRATEHHTSLTFKTYCRLKRFKKIN